MCSGLLLSRDFYIFSNCFLIGIFEEAFISMKNASHRKFRLKSSFKMYRNPD